MSGTRAAQAGGGGAQSGPAWESVLALVGCGLLLVGQLIVYRGSDDQDAAIHAIYARSPTSAGRIVSSFARPLFAVLYIGPGLLGYTAMRIFTACVCLLTAWLVYRVARALGLAHAWIAIPFVVLQPAMFQLGAETMTEPVFALCLAAGLLALVEHRDAVAAVVWSFLPLARPEGPIVLAVIGVAWVYRAAQHRSTWRVIPLLAVGSLVWYLGAFLSTGDPRYISDTFPWVFDTSTIHGNWLHYVTRWPAIVGVGVVVLSLLGIVAAAKRPVLRLAIAVVGAVLAVHTYLWAAGRFASWGFDRYFATMAPLTGLLAVAGLGPDRAVESMACTPPGDRAGEPPNVAGRARRRYESSELHGWRDRGHGSGSRDSGRAARPAAHRLGSLRLRLHRSGQRARVDTRE